MKRPEFAFQTHHAAMNLINKQVISAFASMKLQARMLKTMLSAEAFSNPMNLKGTD